MLNSDFNNIITRSTQPFVFFWNFLLLRTQMYHHTRVYRIYYEFIILLLFLLFFQFSQTFIEILFMICCCFCLIQIKFLKASSRLRLVDSGLVFCLIVKHPICSIIQNSILLRSKFERAKKSNWKSNPLMSHQLDQSPFYSIEW